jgi:hypothetical protein
LPAVAVAVAVIAVAVAEAGGPAPYNDEPIPSLCLQDRDWRLPFLQRLSGSYEAGYLHSRKFATFLARPSFALDAGFLVLSSPPLVFVYHLLTWLVANSALALQILAIVAVVVRGVDPEAG